MPTIKPILRGTDSFEEMKKTCAAAVSLSKQLCKESSEACARAKYFAKAFLVKSGALQPKHITSSHVKHISPSYAAEGLRQDVQPDERSRTVSAENESIGIRPRIIEKPLGD